jgi:hypothetical protein
MRNMTFDNIVIDDSNRGIGLFLRHQGSIENMSFSNMIIKTRLVTGDWWGNGEPIHLSVGRVEAGSALGHLRHIRFHHVICESPAGIVMWGTRERPMEDLAFEDVSLHVIDDPLNDVSGGNLDLRPLLYPSLALAAHDVPGIGAWFVDGLRLTQCSVTWDDVRPAFFTRGLELEGCRDTHVVECSLPDAPHWPGTRIPSAPATHPVR